MSNSRIKSERDYRRSVVRELEEFLELRSDELQQSIDHVTAKLDAVWDEYECEIREMAVPELAGYLVNAVGYYNGIAHPFVRR